VALARPGAVEAVNFQEPAVLDRFPGLTHDICMEAMQLITPDGRVYSGFEAIVRALSTRPVWRIFVYLYYVPLVRQACNALYRFLAARRYRIMGKSAECETGACSIHFK
jgi:predicted DCC family thiol-disulfide oxidoreductase YuxK